MNTRIFFVGLAVILVDALLAFSLWRGAHIPSIVFPVVILIHVAAMGVVIREYVKK